MLREIEMQSNFISEPIETIYFGGGTPSLLSLDELTALLEGINTNFNCNAVKEITLEANPEDLTRAFCSQLKDLGINRLSIGIQSFYQEDLVQMNRVHSENEAHKAIEHANGAGITNITIDLIYGLPWSHIDRFSDNLEILESYDIPHLSAYALTVEPKTALAYQIKMGRQKNVSDQHALEDFQFLQKWAKGKGIRHYEISNLCKPGYESLHNSSYWSGKPYLGIGPAAHSYDGTARYWNVANNAAYVKNLKANSIPHEKEKLSIPDRYNELIMTALRMDVGIDRRAIAQIGAEYSEFFTNEAENKIRMGVLVKDENSYFLSEDQRFFADGHASDLFFTD